MKTKNNILFLMVDQMQAAALRPHHPCHTPNLDALASQGIRFDRAYTPNAICSPARASLMTGLLPHNHGVRTVTHCSPEGESELKTQYPHWAQSLKEVGYQTGYFGKWHVENSNQLEDFGWMTNAVDGSEHLKSTRLKYGLGKPGNTLHEVKLQNRGYKDYTLFSVVDSPPEQRSMWVRMRAGMDWITDLKKKNNDPWCCFISVFEPHDPFVCSKEYFEKISTESLALPENFSDPLEGAPNLYKKSSRVYSNLSDQEKKEAMACYYGSISEIDYLFGKLINHLSGLGVLEDTLIVFTTDHGELLGAHGLYTKNIGAYEEVYNIPLVMAGPGVASNKVCDGRVGLHDLAPTLCEYGGGTFPDHPDSKSFLNLLGSPDATDDWQQAYAEFYGSGSISLTQHVYWDKNMKLVFNGFDEDELYDLNQDPGEMNNLIHHLDDQSDLTRLSEGMWSVTHETGNKELLHTQYPPFRFHPLGPLRENS